MKRIIISVFVNLFFVHCVLAGVAVVDKVSGQVVAVADNDKSFYGYDRACYNIVENPTVNIGADSLKYDKGTIREMSAEEKALAKQAKSWNSDYATLYQMIKDDLSIEGLIADVGQNKKL